MKYNTKYVYSSNCQYSLYIRQNKKFCMSKQTNTVEHTGFDKETLYMYLIDLFDVFIDNDDKAKKPDKLDIDLYYGQNRPDFDKLLNYFTVRYNVYLDVIKKLEDIENSSDINEFTIQFNKDNCKYFDDNKDEFIESYLTIKVEKEQT